MRILRRRFLKTIGPVAAMAFTFPAILRGQMTTSAIQRNVLDMEIKRVGTQASTKGPGDWFTGTVRIDPLFSAPAPARVAGASVTFEPGARTAWHTHPLGQTLIVTAGGEKIPNPGIIVIGKVDSGVEVLDVVGSVKVAVEIVGEP